MANTPMWQKIRKDKGLKVQEVAKDLKCSDKFIYAIESGARAMPEDKEAYYLRMRDLIIDGVHIDLINAQKLEERFNRKRGN